jgi:hypothetical protein
VAAAPGRSQDLPGAVIQCRRKSRESF